MRFQFPGTSTHIRIATPVATADSQYTIVDFGLEHEDGSIDSLAVGGSFATARRWVENANSRVVATKQSSAQFESDSASIAMDLPLVEELVAA